MSWEREVIGDCTLYRGDCLEVVPTLGAIGAVVSDPPYGIRFDFTKSSRRSQTRLPGAGRRLRQGIGQPWQQNVYGDDQRFDPTPWLAFPQVILWGANHYASRLPESAAWLIWDKRVGGPSDDYADCEMAWTNLRGPARVHRQLWRGVCRTGEENPNYGQKLHPTQKPIALMRWCVAKTSGLVLDPYAGSFTTALACVQLGRPCIAVEIDPHFFALGCRRIEDASRQLALFPPAPVAPPPQLALEVAP